MKEETKAPASGNEHVIIITADDHLKRKIGIPLKQLLSKAIVDKAQNQFDKGKKELLKQVLADMETLRLSTQNLTTTSDYTALHIIRSQALRIKGTAGMADYSMATRLADQLSKLLEHALEADPELIRIIQAHVQAMGAIFSEGITGDSDRITVEVIKELQQRIVEYQQMWE